MEEKILCAYGCNQEAKFKITKKKIDCCSESNNKCPENRRKISEALKKDHANNPKKIKYGVGSKEWREKNSEKIQKAIEKRKKTLKERFEAGLIKRNKGYKRSEETKEKIRKTIITQREKKIRNTAWEIRYRRDFSYLERWFYDNVISKNTLEKKYDIVNEYCEYPYFIDFAFINEKIAVELDGTQHYKNIDNGKDRQRDIFLNKKGWIIYRIPHFELKTKDVEKEFMEFLNSKEKKEKTLDLNLIKYKEYKDKIKKNITRNEYFNKLRHIYEEKEKENIEKVLNSNIDFAKFGWVQKVSELINKKPQKINGWIKKFLPNLYEEKCFKRKN